MFLGVYRGIVVSSIYYPVGLCDGDAPDFVEVGEAGIAVDHAMRRRRAVQRSW